MAVYTHLATHEIEALLSEYSVGRLTSALGIAEGVENTNYLIVTESDGLEHKYILTVFEQRVREEDLPFYVGLMEHLAEKQVPCPLPLHTRNGDMITKLPNGKSVALVTFLTGSSMRQFLPEHVREVGEALAKLHLAGKGFEQKRANGLSLAGWRKLYEKTALKADTVQQGLAEVIDKELTYLMEAWPVTLPAGVVHADLFPDNVFFLKGKLSGLIDFYFACNDAFAYDLSVCLNSWCFENDTAFNVTKARALLAGYQSVRPLEALEKQHFVTMARGSALRFMLTRLHDWIFRVEGALVTPKDPIEYLRKLKFHQQIANFEAYGL